MDFVTGSDVWSSFLAQFAAGPAQTFADKLDAVGVVDEAVHDGVSISWVGYGSMPALNGMLRSRDGRMG